MFETIAGYIHPRSHSRREFHSGGRIRRLLRGVSMPASSGGPSMPARPILVRSVDAFPIFSPSHPDAGFDTGPVGHVVKHLWIMCFHEDGLLDCVDRGIHSCGEKGMTRWLRKRVCRRDGRPARQTICTSKCAGVLRDRLGRMIGLGGPSSAGERAGGERVQVVLVPRRERRDENAPIVSSR